MFAASGGPAAPVYKDWMLGPFEKPDSAVNPILGPNFDSRFDCPVGGGPVRWETRAIIGGAAVVRDGRVMMIYQGEDAREGYLLHTNGSPGTMRMGLAESGDGLLFNRLPHPVLYPRDDGFRSIEWPGGCEIPRLVESPDGGYVLTYNAWDKRKARLMAATSLDLRNWEKHGPVFARSHGTRYDHLKWMKSGAILIELRDDRLVAVRVKGKFWMYWGDAGVQMATSDNLVDWTMVENPDGSMFTLLPQRPGRFDDRAIEAGVALRTGKGIVIIYNTFRFRRKGEAGDAVLGSGLGQALVDGDDPTRLLDRSEHPFLVPDREYEIQGAVNNVVFATGLVRFRDRWMLYHNGGDRVMCVAVEKPPVSARP